MCDSQVWLRDHRYFASCDMPSAVLCLPRQSAHVICASGLRKTATISDQPNPYCLPMSWFCRLHEIWKLLRRPGRGPGEMLNARQRKKPRRKLKAPPSLQAPQAANPRRAQRLLQQMDQQWAKAARTIKTAKMQVCLSTTVFVAFVVSPSIVGWTWDLSTAGQDLRTCSARRCGRLCSVDYPT